MANKEQEHVDDWTGNADLLFPSEYIRAADIDAAGKPVPLTIERVEKNAKLTMAGGKVDLKPVIHFAETHKKLVLNKTNTSRVKSLYGAKVQDWKGKKITLTVEPWRGQELAVRVKV